ncbi:MAG: DsbA family protein [Geminicoccaceae bacterium]|nr:DsbA family protein [Geminicoccaceae bacterium]
MELLYAANPMCSWCWGFAPAMRALRERHPDLRLTVVTGRLGHGDGPMRPKDKAEVKRHWEHVHERTGQPFDWAFFERDGFVYDTEPPCRALILVRSAFPALAHPFLERLHERFYERGDDITDARLLAETATEFGVGRDTFERHFKDEKAKAATLAEWQGTARIGIGGYPALLALGAGKPRVVAYGWKPTDEVLAEVASISAASSRP